MMTRRRVTQYSRARRDEPPGSDRGGDTERPGDEPLRRVREVCCCCSAAHGRFRWGIDRRLSFLGFFHQFVHNYYTVRSFVRLYFSFSLSNATRERHVILHSLHRFVSLSLSLFISFSFSLSFFLSLSLKVVVVVRSPCVVGGAGLTRVRVRARD